MGKKLYVGNLPFSATEEVLNDTFSQSGTVESVRIVTDRATGRSKGFGFVEMASDSEALDAINKFNGAEYNGRLLTVNEARPMVPHSARPGHSSEGSRRGGFAGGGNQRRGRY